MNLIPHPSSLIPSLIPHPSSLIPHPFSHPSSLIPSLIPSRKGFTLVELLIVIAIIAILAAVLLGSFGGATESARAAKCLSNMRTLAELSAAAAVKDTKYHWYAAAGSHQILEAPSGGSDKIPYSERPGWISWLSKNEEFKNGIRYGNPASGIEVLPYYGNGNDKDAVFALTNGIIGRLTKTLNRSIYVCPSHEKYRLQRHKPAPVYSYAMNALFGYDSSRGSGISGQSCQSMGSIGNPQYNANDSNRKLLNSNLPPERTLMLAEIGFVKWSGSSWDEVDDKSGEEADMVLNYKATVDGYERGKYWKGAAEEIGFNHKTSGGRRCAHVVFADGHAEKLMDGVKGELDYLQLTAALCEGCQFTFKGDGYYLVK